MTFKQILDQPTGQVNRYLALASLHDVGQDARRKAQTLQERSTHSADDQLMIRWFHEIADLVDRRLELVNESSTTNWPHITTADTR